jgi:hypothetical protein
VDSFVKAKSIPVSITRPSANGEAVDYRTPPTTLSSRRYDWESLSVLIDGEAPPAEFRLFTAGVNETEKGPFIFDDVAARLVMAAFNAHGVDRMLDLEHLSLDEDCPNFDPDARAWFGLEVRDGELWAVNVRWLEDGLARLKKKTQRYISPAFATDDDGRIVKVVNVALTAMPATHDTPALVAAGNRGIEIMLLTPEQLAQIVKLSRANVEPKEILTKLAIDIKTLQGVVKAIGGDPGADLGTLMGVVAKFAGDLAAMAAGEPAPEAAPEVSEEMAEGGEAAPVAVAVSERDAADLQRLRAAEAKKAKEVAEELATLKAREAKREQEERVELVKKLVVLHVEKPFTAWVNSEVGTPKGVLATMPIQELRDRVQAFENGPNTRNVLPPTGSIEMPEDFEVSEYEIKRLHVACEKTGRDKALAEEAYRDHRLQVLNGAREKNSQIGMQRYSRRLDQDCVVASVTGRIGPREITKLAAVKPIETFGAASQRFLEEFNLEMMVNMAALPPDWVDELGETLPSGALKVTYPLDFSAVRYQEKIAQSAQAETPQSSDLSVEKREFRAAKMADLRRLLSGDFAYVKTWQQGAGQMARQRIALKQLLVTTLLEANGTWEDGVAFFATNHKVHPFDPSQAIDASSSTTWGNYDSGATPLTAANLTAQKQASLIVPHFDGLLLNAGMADGILYPASLASTVDDLLNNQAFISSSNAALTNVHYKSGLNQVMGAHLAGSDTTANWYLFNRNAIAQGFVPWVVAEDSSEEVLNWDENSEFYKNGAGFIKTERKLLINAVLVWPHAVRLVVGS